MSSLRNSYNQIKDPGSIYAEDVTVAGSVTREVDAAKVFWTVTVDGPDEVYNLFVRPFGSTIFKPVEEGAINGTPAGFVATFAGAVEAIRIIPTSGVTYSYSMVGHRGV